MESTLDIVQQEEATCPSGCDGCAIAKFINAVGHDGANAKKMRLARHQLVDDMTLHTGTVQDFLIHNADRTAALRVYGGRISICARMNDALRGVVEGAHQGACRRAETDMSMEGAY